MSFSAARKGLAWSVALLLLFVSAESAAAHDTKDAGVRAPAPDQSAYTTYQTPRFILYFGRESAPSTRKEYDVEQIAERSLEILERTYDELSRIFRVKPERKVVLRFLPPEEFRRQTGAPAWTSAMYFRDEISIPLTRSAVGDSLELERAIRHEYVHAVIAEISNYRCPAWLDEGIAQILEGEPNPLLGPSLRRWIANNPALPLDWLHNGFTTLDANLVPAAYAQSLFATRKLVRQHGFGAVVKYLSELREGRHEAIAFRTAFGIGKAQFERELTGEIRRWAASNQAHP